MTREKDQQYSVSYVPTLKISHNYLVCYSTRISDQDYSGNNYRNFFDDNERIDTYSGEISKGSRKRLQEACELMEVITDYKYYISPKSGKRAKFKIGFLTTTLSAPQGTVSDRDIKKNLLEPYLRKLKKYGLKNYIWKAELQNNGNLHFHIFLDCYIDKTDARNIWNRLQSKFHFITAFEAKHGHRDPNSTDIRPVNTNSSMTRYMLKYMIKPVEKGNQLEIGRPAEKSDFGKVWDCSRPLKEKNNTAQFVTNEDFEHVERAIDQGFLKEVKKDFATIYYINNRKLWQYLPSHLIDPYYNYLKFVKELRA